jgi:hypothetical protein
VVVAAVAAVAEVAAAVADRDKAAVAAAVAVADRASAAARASGRGVCVFVHHAARRFRISRGCRAINRFAPSAERE